MGPFFVTQLDPPITNKILTRPDPTRVYQLTMTPKVEFLKYGKSLLTFFMLLSVHVIICPIAIAYSMGQIINRFASVSLSVSESVYPSVCGHFYARAALEICGWAGPRLGGLGDGSPPVGSRGKAPVGGLEDEVPQKLKHFLKNRY